jgi:hypothetical protein
MILVFERAKTVHASDHTTNVMDTAVTYLLPNNVMGPVKSSHTFGVSSACRLLLAGFLFDLLIDPEDRAVRSFETPENFYHTTWRYTALNYFHKNYTVRR